MRALAASALILLASVPCRGDLLACGTTRPLLKFYDSGLTLLGGGIRSITLEVLCRDGRWVRTQTTFGLSVSGRATDLSLKGSIARGRVDAATIGKLRDAMEAAQIGVMQSCSVGGPPESTSLTETTWFGASQRQNSFVFEHDGESNVPYCSNAALQLYVLITALELGPGITEAVPFP